MFEIRANLKFIYKQDDPHKYLERLNSFAKYENIIHKNTDENTQKKFAEHHPYWSKKDGTLKKNAEWHGIPDKKIKDICIDIQLLNEYEKIYKMTSKFVHGSPIIKNTYIQADGNQGSLAKEYVISPYNILTAVQLLSALEEFFYFFKFGMDEENLKYLLSLLLELEKDFN